MAKIREIHKKMQICCSCFSCKNINMWLEMITKQNKSSDFMRLSLYKSLDSVEVLKGIIAGFVILNKIRPLICHLISILN